MNEAFYIGATGLRSAQNALEVISNNVANMNTTAFKRSSVQFSELISPSTSPSDPPSADADAASLLAGVMVSGSPRDFSQGTLQTTGQTLDLAINGQGFVELLGPSGQVLLWRGGTMQINPDGHLAAPNGMVLKANITVPSSVTSLTIGPDGAVQAVSSGSTATTTLGHIELATTNNPNGLSDLGGGIYQPSDEHDLTIAPAGQNGTGLLAQGALEQSNVQLTDEMVNLMLIQRAYSANAQVVQAGDQLMSIANSLKR